MFYSEEEQMRILKSISKFDELSLYLEICKYENILENLKNHATIVPGKIQFQAEIIQTKEILNLHFKELERFGIMSKDKTTIALWKEACADFLNSLDMIEYATLMQTRMSGKPLDLFCSSEKLHSAFLKSEEENQKEDFKENTKAMKIS